MSRKIHTTIFHELENLYRKCPQRSLEADLAHFLSSGYIFSGPNYILMGQRVGIGWHIHVAIGIGAIRKFGELMPYYLPFIGWAREAKGRSEVVWHSTETIYRRLNMQLTEQQLFEKCHFAAASIVGQYREQCPNGFDPQGFGGGMPSPPKPPAPPSANQASSILDGSPKRKKVGFASTILTGKKTQMGDTAQGTQSILGG